MVHADGIETILFDLDGTLVDTAPDLARALNDLRARRDAAPLPFAHIRPHVSAGANALIRLGFVDADADEFAGLRSEFLALYADGLARDSAPFPGMPETLDALERHGLRWGIVTNKPAYLTGPLLAALGLDRRAACVVSGDTLPRRKPDPAPLLHACRLAGSAPGASVYVGDAEGDIIAGRGGGLRTALALFGYLDAKTDPAPWGADIMIERPQALLDWIGVPA